MSELRTPLAVFDLPSASEPGRVHRVKLYENNGAFCPCRGFMARKTCRHVRRARHLHEHPVEAFADDLVRTIDQALDQLRPPRETDEPMTHRELRALGVLERIGQAARAVLDGAYSRDSLSTTSDPSNEEPEPTLAPTGPSTPPEAA